MTKTTEVNLLLDTKLILNKINITDNIRIADLGCGSLGYFIFLLAERVGNNGLVYAVDILKSIIESLEKKIKIDNIKNVKPIWSDLEVFGATHIESGSLDTALLINTLFQSKKRAGLLREATRMLKKGGQLIIIEWKNVSLPFGPQINERVQEDLLRIACQKLGYELENDFIAGPYHYGLIFIKK
jgi:ubiquinone/menaquinone biosynthesis C-methylase UbiE